MNSDVIFLNIAAEIAKLSKCVSHKVGCIIVKNGRILSTGYNGTPKGFINCCDRFPLYNKEVDRPEHRLFSSKFEIHAELNAILWAARNGIPIEGSTLYSTLQPCIDCTKNLTQAGIKTIVFKDVYDMNSSEMDYIKELMQLCDIEYYKS